MYVSVCNTLARALIEPSQLHARWKVRSAPWSRQRWSTRSGRRSGAGEAWRARSAWSESRARSHLLAARPLRFGLRSYPCHRPPPLAAALLQYNVAPLQYKGPLPPLSLLFFSFFLHRKTNLTSGSPTVLSPFFVLCTIVNPYVPARFHWPI
jgi:hypothetical protein